MIDVGEIRVSTDARGADSGGAYDPCAGALVNLWGFGAQRRYDQPGFQAPASAAIAAVIAQQILYPASSVHRVEPVSRGERVGACFWIQSMVREDARRAMLLELDRTITGLRTRLGDCAEIVSLTAQYYKLLRMWADI
jgi:hypothetical protein